jgi:hypothetical protein
VRRGSCDRNVEAVAGLDVGGRCKAREVRRSCRSDCFFGRRAARSELEAFAVARGAGDARGVAGDDTIVSVLMAERRNVSTSCASSRLPVTRTIGSFWKQTVPSGMAWTSARKRKSRRNSMNSKLIAERNAGTSRRYAICASVNASERR